MNFLSPNVTGDELSSEDINELIRWKGKDAVEIAICVQDAIAVYRNERKINTATAAIEKLVIPNN